MWKTITALASILIAATLTASPANAYTTYASWTTSSVVVYANPENTPAWMTPSQFEASVQAAINDWNTQGRSNITLIYGGTTGAGQALDGLNVVSFADAPSPNGYIAFTFSQWDSSRHLLDSDTVLYPPYQFFADDQACPYVDGNVFLHDMMTHEFGHMLGLNHSADPEATMFGRYVTCSTTQRTLEADDIVGLQALYGATTDPIPLPPPSPLCPWGPTASATLRNGQVGAWITAREAEGYVLVSSIKLKGSTTITMQCGG